MIQRFILASCFLASCVGRDPKVLRNWLADWEAARSCMLGAHEEYGPDSAVALTIASFVANTDCSEKRLKLIAISDDDQRSIPDWSALRDDLDVLQRSWEDGAVIDRIDERVHRLREAARLPAMERVPRRVLDALPPGRTVVINGDALSTNASFERGVIAAVLAINDRETMHVEVESLDHVKTWSVPAGYVTAYPSRSWAAEASGRTLTVAELGSGQASEIELPGPYLVSRAMDSGSTRAVFLRAQTLGGFAVAVSTDGGRSWTIKQSTDTLPLERTSQDRKTGAVDVLVGSEGHSYLHRFAQIEPWEFAPRVEIPKVERYIECRDAGVLWLWTGQVAHRLVRITPTDSRTFESTYLVGEPDCRGETALVLDRGLGDRLDLYRDDKAETVYRAAHRYQGAATLSDDGKWMYAVVKRGFVGVWREGVAEPTFYRLQKPGELVKLVVLAGHAYLVLVIDGGYQFVALPPS